MPKKIYESLFIVILFCLSASTANQVFAKEPTTFSRDKGLFFIENSGQVTNQYFQPRNDIDFSLSAGGMNIFIGSGHIHYQWSHSTTQEVPGELFPSQNIEVYRLDVELSGANKNVIPEAGDYQEYYEQYFLEHTHGTVKARSCKKIIYRNIYPGIDWVLYPEGTQLKYDFIVHKGADISKIKLEYSGAEKTELLNGDIVVSTPFGSITESAPYTYDAITKEPISSSYVLNENILTFDVSAHSNDIVIDPSLEWASYYGGTGLENGYSVVTDTSENVYMVGATTTTSSLTIATSGAHQTSLKGKYDGYIVKFNKAGLRQWGTYYGGSEQDQLYSVAINSDNDLLIAGITDSSYNLAISSPHQSTHGGGVSDCFLLKLSDAGSPIWCTYYGGAGTEKSSDLYQVDVFCDTSDNIYLVGNTQSDTGIATTGTQQTSRSTKFDGFVAKFNKSGVRQWGSYYGGSDEDHFRKVVVDYSGNVYAAGVTYSSGLGTTGTHKNSLTGKEEAILVKFSPSGSRIWASYFGGSNETTAEGLAIYHSTKELYMTGSTTSTTGIATSGTHLTSHQSGYDAYIAKFDSTGNQKWGSYYGGGNIDYAVGLTVDAAGNPCFTGQTSSTSGIATTGAHQTTYGGGSSFDGFLTVFSSAGKQLWGTYYGDIGNDYGYGITALNTGHMYMVGITASTTKISHSGFQNTFGGSNDAFIAKFTPDTSVFIFQPFTQTSHCINDTFTLDYGVTSPFYTNNTYTVQLSDANGSFTNPTTIGTGSGTSGGQIKCQMPATPGTGFRIRIIASNPADTSFDNGSNISIKPKPVKPTSSSNTPVCSNDTLKLYANSSTPGVSYHWTGPGNYSSYQKDAIRIAPPVSVAGDYIVSAILNGCYRDDTTTVSIKQAPSKPDAQGNSPLCSGDSIVLKATNLTFGVTINWTGPNNFSSSQQNPAPIKNSTTAHSGNYIISTGYNNCTSRDTVNIVVNQSPAPVTATNNGPVCSNDTLRLYATTASTGVNYSWTGPGGFSTSTKDPVRGKPQLADSGDYIVEVSMNGCSRSDTTHVQILEAPQVPKATANSPLCEGENLTLSGSNLAGNTSWTGPGAWTANSTPAIRSKVSLNDSGDYVLTNTLNGCIERDTVNVKIIEKINVNFTVNVSPGTLVCPTADLEFNITPSLPSGTTYSWTGPGGWASSSLPAQRNNVIYDDSGYYKVKAVVNQCNYGEDSIFVHITDTIPPPVITLPWGPACDKDSFQLFASYPTTQVTLTWTIPSSSTPFVGQRITKKPVSISADTGIYIVQAYAGGCTAYDTLHVTDLHIKPRPAIPVASSNSPICENQQIQLNGSNTTSGVNYEWTGPGGFTSFAKDTSINGASTGNAGFYRLWSVLNGCRSLGYDSTEIVINNNPKPNISTTNNGDVCEGDAITLSVQADSIASSYSWSKQGGGFSATGLNANVDIAALSDEGYYIVEQTINQTGCKGTDTTFINVIPLPIIKETSNNSPVCEGDELKLWITDDSATDVTYSWIGPKGFNSTDKNTSLASPTLSSAGSYTITVDRQGCIVKDSTDVVIKKTPEKPSLTSNSPVALGSTLQLQCLNPTPGASFKWTGPNSFGSFVQNPVINKVNTSAEGTYTLTTILDGCISSGITIVKIEKTGSEQETLILYPNPNNGNFTVKATLLHDQEMPYEVVNAVGMVVYRKMVVSQNLEMTEKVSIKDLLPSGVYVFRILMSGRTREIPFSIVR